MKKDTWKDFERRVARFFGTERMPLSGMSNFLEKQDTLHPLLFIECKMRTELPLWDFWERMGDFCNGDICVVHSNSFKRGVLPGRQSKRVRWFVSLYNEVSKRAVETGKIPLLAIKKKGKKGFLIILHRKDFEDIWQITFGIPEKIDFEGVNFNFSFQNKKIPELVQKLIKIAEKLQKNEDLEPLEEALIKNIQGSFQQLEEMVFADTLDFAVFKQLFEFYSQLYKIHTKLKISQV